MLLLDREAISPVAHGPKERRDRVRALVADADLRGGAMIATVDIGDIEALASHARRVRVADLDT